MSLLLALRGALWIIAIFGSTVFWSWLLLPSIGSPLYETIEAAFGGFCLLITVGFLAALLWRLMP